MNITIQALSVVTLALLPSLMIAQVKIGKTDTFTNNRPWQVPGQVLKPGTYQIRVDDSMSDRAILQILSADQKEVLTTFISVPNNQLRAESSTSFAFWGQQGGDLVVRAWVPSGETTSREFVYEKEAAAKIATQIGQSVPAVDPSSEPKLAGRDLSAADMRTIQLWALSLGTATANKEPAINAVKLDRSSFQSAQEINSPFTIPKKLPSTASPVPLLAIFGILSLIGACSMRFWGGERNRM